MGKQKKVQEKITGNKKIKSSKEHRARGPLGYKLRFEKEGKYFSCRSDIFVSSKNKVIGIKIIK